jgi:hypothetical protein
MTDQQRIEKFAQSVHLAANNRYFDDLAGTDGQEYIAQIIDWCNQFIEELELETDWAYVRSNDFEIGDLASLSQTFELPITIRKLVVDEGRPLRILQDSTAVSNWDVVPPNLITNPNDRNTSDRVTVVNNKVIFSRPLRDTELAGVVSADVIHPIPRLSATDVSVFDIVSPYQLLVLGVVKNTTLSDIVQGGLSPSFTQKYKDLLDKAHLENQQSSLAASTIRDDYGYLGGIF